MAKTFTSELTVQLIDRVTGVAGTVGKSLRNLGREVDRVNNQRPEFATRVDAALTRSQASLERARGGIVDAAASFYTLKAAIAAPISAAADFEAALEDIGQKVSLPVAQLGALGDRIKAVARDTNQANSQIAAAVDALAGRGANIDQAMAAAAPIGKAATAYRAATDDLAAASWAAVDNLKVPADQISRALDMMASAGKAGAFELRDMATYFPQLGAAYQGLGQTGVESVADLAAALQVVRKGTGDSSTAATNLANVLQKIYSPTTVRAFGKQGVDVFAEMEAAAERGLTPIEAIAELTDRTLKGDLSKMGNLFEDAQVQAGMRSLIQGMEEYRAIRAEAMQAEGVIDADFARRIKTTAGMMARWTAVIDNLNQTVGAALTPALVELAEKIEPILRQVTDLIAANPKLTSSLMLAAGGMIAFKGAIAGLKFVGLLGKTGALTMLSMAMHGIGRATAGMVGAARASVALQTALAGMDGAKIGALTKVGAAMRGIAGVVGLRAVAGAISGVVGAIGAISAPVWLGIAAAVAAVGAAWKYWDRISAIATGVGAAISQALAPALVEMRPVLEAAQPALARIGEAFRFVDDKIRGLAGFVRSLGGNLFSREILTEQETSQIKARAQQLTTDILNYFDALPGKLVNIGRQVVGNFLAGMQERWADVQKWLAGVAAEVAAAFRLQSSITPGSLLDKGRNLITGGPDGARAKGGRISPGRSYLVGEEGAEVITPSRSGYVHPSGSLPGGGSLSVQIGDIIVPGAGNAEAVAERVMQRLRAETGMALRSAYADLGVA